MVTQTIRVNLNQKDLETIQAVQNDTLREIAFEFYATDAEDAVQLDPDEYEVKFNVLKPDNNFVMTTFTDGVIKLSDQMTAVTGTGYYCILLMKDDELIYSGNGKIIINDHVIGAENIDSVSEADGYTFPDDFYTKDTPLAVLDDSTTSTTSTWSSNKINGEINTASTSAIAQLNAMKTGFDLVEYESPAAMVQGCDTKLQDQITALPQNNYVNTIYGRSAYWDKPEGVSQTIQNGIINFKDGSTYTGGTTVHIEIPISSYVDQYIAVSGHSATVSSSVYYALCGIYDSSDNLLEMHGSSSSTTYEYLVFKVPTGASKIIVNGDSSYATPTLYINNAIVSELLKPAFEYANRDKDDSGSHLFVYNEPEYVSGGLRNFKNNTSYGSSGGKKYTVSPGDLCIISGQTASVSSSVNYNLYGFYDSEMNLLSVYNGVGSTVYSNVQVIAPSNAAYCWVNGGSNKTALLNVRTSPDIKTYIDTHAGTPSIWAGKKIGVLGTSAAFGQLATTSYSYEAAQILGYDLKMFGLPGLAIQTNDDGTPKTYGSFTLSKSEYASAGWTLPDAPITPYVPGGSYNNYYRTYENVFVQENADIDLWVYAVIPNNGTFDLDDWNAFDKNQWKYSDNSSFADHRKTFLGALLFIMDQMYTLNPNARMILLVDSSFDYANGLSNFETVAQQWNIPIIDLWGKINTSPKSLIQLKSEGGTNQHPSTFAHQIMGRMLSGDLESVS